MTLPGFYKWSWHVVFDISSEYYFPMILSIPKCSQRGFIPTLRVTGMNIILWVEWFWLAFLQYSIIEIGRNRERREGQGLQRDHIWNTSMPLCCYQWHTAVPWFGKEYWHTWCFAYLDDIHIYCMSHLWQNILSNEKRDWLLIGNNLLHLRNSSLALASYGNSCFLFLFSCLLFF